MIPFAILVGVLVGLLCDRLMLAHSASLRDKKSMKDYERTRHWPRHCATDDGFWEMEAQMETRR